MKTKITILLLSGIFICRFSFAQSNSFSTGQTKQPTQFIKFDEASGMALAEFPMWASTHFKLAGEYKFELINSAPDNLGMVHYRYRQTCNRIPLEGTMYIVHTKNGKITSMNGEVFNKITSNKMPALNEQAALSNALADINASLYKWQVPEEESRYKLETKNAAATYFPKGELVYAAADGKFRNENFKLAWKFDIYAVEPLSRNYVYVDAITGYVIGKQSRIYDVDSYGTATTAYSGSQTIAAENYLGSYRLRETGRGGGINTYNMLTGTTYANAVDFTDADNLWNNVNPQLDQYATDAHWGAEMTYDYYLTRHNRHSIDNANFPLNSYVHYGVNYSNAFWDGQRMTYGDGGGSYNPFTALDITGHEITHGVTSFSSNLNYSYESGALNESFSDIFGTAIEFFARPSNANWLIGSDIGVTIRDMSNPNAAGGPDTYGGLYWATGSWDNGGVHTNSQVQNFWFYLLAQGGSGTNDIGNYFSVTGIGILDAAAIAYRTNCFYLTSTSQYADARFYSIQSATDLFGACSQQVISTTDAWYAVGVGTTSPVSITASGPTTFYAPGSVILNASMGPGYSYQWRLNGVNIPGATSSSYTASSSGNYDCIVSNGICSATSNSITVTVLPPIATPDWLWARRIGATGADHGSVTAVDASGNIYLAGTFTGTVDFDPGPGTFNLTAAGTPDIFVSKFDGGGNFIWAKRIGGYGFQDVSSIVLDNAGNIYTSGYFAGTSDFDPGPGVYNLTSLTGYPDVFICKLDNTGNLVWVKQFSGAQSDVSNSLVIDASGNIYTTGSFQGTVDFDPGAGTFNMTSAGSSDIYVSKLDASGNLVWAKQVGSTGSDGGSAIKIDGSGNIYYTGGFNGTVDFDPGTGVFNLTSAGSDDIFISKLDNSGNFVWAKEVGGFYQDGSRAIAIGPGGDIYTTGYFQTTVDFDPGIGVFNLTASMGEVFILKLDASGNFVWAKQLGGPGPDEGRSITVDPTNGDVYTEGNFSVTADFDPGTGTFNLFSNGMHDFFISKLDANGNFLWAKAAGGTLNDSYESSITLSPSGNIHLTGRFTSPTIAFGLTTLTNASNNEDIFLAKLDNSVLPPGAMITANGPTSFCASGSVTLNANTGAGLSYQWRKNNANIAGATASSYVASSTGYYECLVSNSTGSSISNLIAVLVPAGPPPAVITAGPYGSTNCWPNGVMLTANADTGVTYQWRQSGVPIAGRTAISYMPGTSGDYDCVVTNVCGSTPSNTITVVYYTSPPSAVITAADPATFCAPGSVILNANTGLGFSYQWKLNSVSITGATNSSYTAATGGNYTCIVSNQCGSSTSNAITVTVSPLPASTITAAGPTTFCAAGSVTLNANTGAGLSYQWRLNGTNISGATGASYSASLAGNYNCVVTNSCGSTTSNTITVTVVNGAPSSPGSISGQTAGVCSSTRTYSISAVANATSYTWTVPSGASISSGQGTISVNVIFTSSFGSGNVSVVATNLCGSSGSSSLAVSGAPALPGNITGPVSVCHNQNNVIYSIAAITGATSYTWTVPPGTQIKNGQGTTQIRVRFGNSAGNITVRANNACGQGSLRTLAIAMPCREDGELDDDFDVTLYPNPATDKLTVVCNTLYGNESVIVYNAIGENVLHSEIRNQKSEINISMLPDGMYFTEIISGEQKKVLKFIKQE